MFQTMCVLASVIAFIASHYVLSVRRDKREAERRKLRYVKMSGRTGRLHGMDEQLFRATAEKRDTWK